MSNPPAATDKVAICGSPPRLGHVWFEMLLRRLIETAALTGKWGTGATRADGCTKSHGLIRPNLRELGADFSMTCRHRRNSPLIHRRRTLVALLAQRRPKHRLWSFRKARASLWNRCRGVFGASAVDPSALSTESDYETSRETARTAEEVRQCL